MPAAPRRFRHQDTTSSDINIEEKPHIFSYDQQNFLSQTKSVFRLQHIACDGCLCYLTSLGVTVTDEIPHQSPVRSPADLDLPLSSEFQKGDKSLQECSNPRNPLCGLNENIQNEKDTGEKKKKTWALEQCLKQHSTQDEHWRFLWNSCQDKKASSSVHIKEQWKLSRGGFEKCLPFIITCENKRPCKADWHGRRLI